MLFVFTDSRVFFFFICLFCFVLLDSFYLFFRYRLYVVFCLLIKNTPLSSTQHPNFLPLLARPPTTSSTSTPHKQSGPANSIPSRFAAAFASRSAGRDTMEQVVHAQQQIAVQAEAQAQAGSLPVAGDSPTTSAQNSVGGSYSDLDGMLRAVWYRMCYVTWFLMPLV